MNSFFGPPRTGLIYAADLDSVDQNCKVLDQIASSVDVIKVCSPLIYREGISAIGILSDRYGLPVLADLKVADVPHTNASIVRAARQHGASAIMVHGFIGIDGIEACLRTAEDRMGIIILVELTNPGASLFSQVISDDIVKLVKDLPIFGVQAPGNRPDRIRHIRSVVGGDKVIVCCGVGAQGGLFREVRAAGGDYAIVGRAIYLSDDPVAAVENILSS